METTTATSPKEKWTTLATHAGVLSPSANVEHFELPTTRHEEWKYTRTTRIAAEEWKWTKDENTQGLEDTIITDLNALRIVYINGQYSPNHSQLNDIAGLSIRFNQDIPVADLASFQTEEAIHFFDAMARQSSSSAVYIQVAKNTILDKNIHIVHLNNTAQTLSTAAVFVHVHQSAFIQITETFHGIENTKTLVIRGLQARVEENARMEYVKIQAEKDDQFHIAIDRLHLASNAYSNFNTLTVDGGWVRNDLRMVLDGQNIEAHINGFYLPRRKQLIDNHTMVDHRYPHCNSNELYKGILFDQATGVFNGKVYVRKDAQKTNAYQNNANVLVGEDATMNTKPELEIYADDVKCSHGTTTGQIDESAMFYLRARGLGEDSARKLLTTAFINDVLNKVDNEAVRIHVLEALSAKGLLYS